MPSDIYWIKKAKSRKQRGLSLDLVQLSTFNETSIIMDSDERISFRNSLKKHNVELLTVDELVGSVCQIINKKVTDYIGNLFTDVMVDVFEPDRNAKFFNIKKVPLYAGDYMWLTNKGQLVLVERKQLANGELINALFQPRQRRKGAEPALTAQARKMNQVGDLNFLLVELGSYSIDYKTGQIRLPQSRRPGVDVWPYKWSQIEKRKLTLIDSFGLHVWYTVDSTTTPYDIAELRQYLNTERRTPAVLPASFIQAKQRNLSTEIQALSLVKGISVDLAKKALEHFGSLSAMSTASVKDWQSVPGFGKTKATAMYEFFNKEY